MARNRIIYQSEALYVGPIAGGTATEHKQITRVQDVSHDMSATRNDIYEFGRLAALDRPMIEAPTVSLDFTYLLTDGTNESNMGLTVQGFTSSTGSFLSGILADEENGGEEKNYYVVTVPEGDDADDEEDNWSSANYNSRSIVGFGNGVLSNYTVNGAVGDFPSASVSVEAYNVSFISGQTAAAIWVSGDVLPAVNKGKNTNATGSFALDNPTTGDNNVFALRPGDITMSFDQGGSDTTTLSVGGAVLPAGDPDSASASTNPESMHLQNFSIEAPLSRTSLTRLGSTFPYFKAIDFPQECTLNTSAYLADVSTGSLVDLLCDDKKYDIEVNMRVPCSAGQVDSDGDTNMVFTVKNALLNSQNFSASIGDTKTVDLSFGATYGGRKDASNGLFISGTA